MIYLVFGFRLQFAQIYFPSPGLLINSRVFLACSFSFGQLQVFRSSKWSSPSTDWARGRWALWRHGCQSPPEIECNLIGARYREGTCERGDGEGVGEGVRVEAAERFGAGTERGLPATRGGKGLRVTTDWGRPWESHNMKTWYGEWLQGKLTKIQNI